MEKAAFSVAMTPAMVDLIMAIFASKDDLKGLSVHRVLRMWPAHHKQFIYYATVLNKMGHQAVMCTAG